MFKASVITVSDKGFRGEREDTAGPLAAEMLKEAGYEVIGVWIDGSVGPGSFRPVLKLSMINDF